jgi:serine protease Do
VLLKIDAKTPEFFELPDKPNVEKGDWVLSVANPFKVADRDEPLSVNLGVVSLRTEVDAKKRSQDVDIEGEMLLIDAITSNPGAPGGALMTADKKLAGMIGKIIESKSTNTRLNYAIPSDRLKVFLDNKEAPPIAVTPPVGSTGKVDLGIRLFRLSGKRAPAYIDRVLPGSAAEKAGLQKDDLILRIGVEFVSNISDYDEIAGKLRAGEEIPLIFKRKNEVLSVRITPVGEKPE